jgi:hypothetical protein
MTSRGWSLLVPTIAALLLGCVDERSDPHAGPACTSPGCGVVSNPPSTSGGAGGDNTGGSGVGEPTDVTGTVKVMDDPAFLQTQVASYDGAATILAQPQGATEGPSTPYGDGQITFTLSDVPAGAVWMIVRDETNGGTGVLSTVTAQFVPSAAPLVLPVVDRVMLENIAATFVGQPTIDTGRAHVAVTLERDGAPIQDVALDPGSTYGGVVAYDLGSPGQYSNDVLATGAAGRILLINAQPPAGGLLVLNVIDQVQGNTYPLQIRLFAEAVAVVAYDLP